MRRDNDDWVQALGARQEPALADLRTALLRNLRSALARRAGADESFLEDTVQESLLRILDRIDQFEGRSRFLTWATSIAIRIAMSHLRRKQWRDVSLDDMKAGGDLLPQRTASSGDAPEVQAQRRALLEALRDAMERDLTERQRTALYAELKGMPQEEIARHLDSNRNAVYKLTHDARKKLRKRLGAAGYTTEDVIAAVAS